MRVFLTGATGFIGNAVARALARAGHQVTGLVRKAEQGAGLAGHEIGSVVGNLQAPDSWRDAAARCQVFVHCAADHATDASAVDDKTVDTFLELVQADGRLFVYTSGVWVLGDTGGVAVDETAPLAPPAKVKARVQTEARILAAATAKRRTLVLRPGCVYGGSGSLTGLWFDSAAREGAAQIVGQGDNHWAMVHHEDLADCYVRAVESECWGEVFHITDPSRDTIRACAVAASRAVGADGHVVAVSVAEASKKFGAMAECLALDQQVDAGKAARWLGWQARARGFVAGAERYAAAWRAQSRN